MVSIGIGIPVRNGENYLHQALQSALAQTKSADEIVVVINNSSDRSWAICQEFLPYIRIVEDNAIHSIGAAWNAVYQYSRSDYVVMLHQDDVLDENTIKILTETINCQADLGLVFGRMNLISEHNTFLRINYDPEEVCLTGKDYLDRVIWGLLPGCSGMCVKRDLILENPYRTDLNIALDIEFFIRMGWTANVLGIPDVLSSYRLHSASTLHSDTHRNSQKDLLRWWQLLEAGAIQVPEEWLHIYQAGLLKRIVTVLLQDLQQGDRIHTFEWINFIDHILKKYPSLYRTSFTIRSRMIYELIKIRGIGYAIAYSILQIRSNFRLKTNEN